MIDAFSGMTRPKKQQHRAKRLFERLRDEHGFTGGITIVKDYVAGWRQRAQEMFVPLVHPPGHAQADFGEAIGIIGGVERKIHFFAFWPSYPPGTLRPYWMTSSKRVLGHLKINRAIATRYDQLADSFLGMQDAGAGNYRSGLLVSPLVHFGACGFCAFCHFGVKAIDYGREADAVVLAVGWSTCERLVVVFEIMAAHKHRTVGNATDVVHKTGRPSGLVRCAHKAGIEHPAVAGPHVKLADDDRFAEAVQKVPACMLYPTLVDVKAHDIAEFRASFHTFRCIRGKPTAQI